MSTLDYEDDEELPDLTEADRPRELNITIVNKKYDGGTDNIHYPGSAVHYVGRGRNSVLGNPYSHRSDVQGTIKTDTVQEAVDKYQDWLRTQYVSNPAVRQAVHKIADDFRAGKDVWLVCWCAPPGGVSVINTPWICHAQVIANAVIKITEKAESNEQTSQEGKE